jgi:hypothetical protein
MDGVPSFGVDAVGIPNPNLAFCYPLMVALNSAKDRRIGVDKLPGI